MHDANGRLLQVGDSVIIPAIIESLSAGENFCNVTVETTLGRRPDGMLEHIGCINTGVLLKVNPIVNAAATDAVAYPRECAADPVTASPECDKS